MNSQANETPDNHDFSNKLASVLLDVQDSWESLTPQVLLLEQEAYLSYINKRIKKIQQTTDPHRTIIRNRLQKTLGKIRGENRSVTIIKIE